VLARSILPGFMLPLRIAENGGESGALPTRNYFRSNMKHLPRREKKS
jgi:hypothetical protein